MSEFNCVTCVNGDNVLRIVAEDKNTTGEVVSFPSGELTLHGVLYKPKGAGPFPAVVYNHGSAPGMLSSEAFEAIGPLFASRGWVFFGPYRRGQGLSASAGPYIGDEIAAAEKRGGMAAAESTMIRLLKTDHPLETIGIRPMRIDDCLDR